MAGSKTTDTPAAARPRAIFLIGPTAVGKTALACNLYDRFPLELVNVDSAQVYRQMDIGTAKPDAATLARYPHWLIDIRDPSDAYSAAQFREDALAAMAKIRAAGRIPLLVGGTGLYFRALQGGLSDLPAAAPSLRARYEREALQHGWPHLHARLAGHDPSAAQRIHATDSQRISRALEVIELTGRSLSSQQRGGTGPRPDWHFLKLALMPPDRSQLHENIAHRLDAMLAEGFMDEVRHLHARGDLHADLPSMRSVGYRQAWQHLEGELDFDQFRNHALAATRQLAKRQMTWIRTALDTLWIDPQDEAAQTRAARLIEAFLPPHNGQNG